MNALPPLTTEEIKTFITNGFVIKRKVLDPELCAAARDRLWAGNTSSQLRRDDPTTWTGGLPESDRTSTPDGMNDRTGNYGWRLRELSGDENLINLLWPALPHRYRRRTKAHDRSRSPCGPKQQRDLSIGCGRHVSAEAAAIDGERSTVREHLNGAVRPHCRRIPINRCIDLLL